MLAAHREVAVPPESHWIPRVARRFASGWHGNARAGRFADAVSAGRRFEYWGISREELIALIDEHRPADVAGAIRLLYASWAAAAGKPRYADKTPAYVTRIARLARLFDEARFVHLIRDGRDVALSVAESFERGPQTAAQGALFWSARVRAGREQGRALGPDRYLELRYEELVAEPEATLRELCRFLELDFDASMLEPERQAERIAAGYPDAAVHPNLAEPLAMRRDWRTEMSAAQRRAFELIAGDLLDELGYPTEGVADDGDAERERLALLEAELEGLRHDLFKARGKAERRGVRIARLKQSRWAAIRARLGGLVPRARRRG